MALVDVRPMLPDAIFDLRYGTENNFVGRVLHPDYPALLEEIAAEGLVEVQKELGNKALTLVLYDLLRPQSVHDQLMQANPNPEDVNPDSPHLWGGAADLMIAFKNGGHLMDMGCGFDEFGEKAHPDYPKLTVVQKHNRAFQTDLMKKHGFVQWPTELWHFGFHTLLERPASAQSVGVKSLI